MDSPKSIAVIGGGSWATALVKIFSENSDITVDWWMRNQDAVDHIKNYRHNPNYISSVQFDLTQVKPSTNLLKVVSSNDIIVLATPAAFLNQQLQKLPKDIFKTKKVASSIKGIIPETFQVIGHYMLETWGLDKENLAVITGPCHAEEVALEKLSYLTVASLNEDLAYTLASMIKGRYIQTKVTDDVFGVEYAAVLKNVYAIACGICHGLGYGDNFQAVLVSKSSQEMERFLDDCHEQHRDVKENAYLGDLLVTAYSQFSRNRTFGNMLGKGYTVKSAQMEMNMVAEGYYSTKTMQQINEKIGTDMPILTAVNEIIYNKKSPRKTFKDLEPLLI
jgi:glycerol-3-phosphate dehydrogenase (NAD(P)+)